MGLVSVIIRARWFLRLVWLYTPYAYFPEAIVALHHGRYDEAMLLFALVVSVAYVLLAVLLLIYTAKRFDAIVGRAPQTDPLAQPAVQAATAAAAVA